MAFFQIYLDYTVRLGLSILNKISNILRKYGIVIKNLYNM